MSAAIKGAQVAGVGISNSDRVVFPELGLTKLDVARHFAAVAQRMLPHVQDRPLSLLRCPEGIADQCFFQKHWQGRLPDTLDTVAVRESSGTRPYVVVNDAAGLVTLAQWGTIEVHPWPARADRLERPDRVTFDLDPGPGVQWRELVHAARDLRDLIRRIGLVPWAMISGGKGIHVVVPLQRHSDWEQVSTFARTVAKIMALGEPDRFVARADKSLRKGRIFIDWLRNTRGATAIAPWSPRARASAGVAVPITWERLGRIRQSDQYQVGQPLPSGDAWEGFRESAGRITIETAELLGEI